MALLNILISLLVGLVTIPALFFLLEIVGSFLPKRTPLSKAEHPPKNTVKTIIIVPAHNEGANLLPTLQNLLKNRTSEQMIYVVADNCTDDTATLAKQAFSGHKDCFVLERNNPALRGKGYALAYGLDAIADLSPDCVIFMDADCLAEPSALTKIAEIAVIQGRPVQALYLMQPPQTAENEELHEASQHATLAKLQIGAFAWAVMNHARMQGLYTLFDVTRLTGSGMAFPYRILQDHFTGSDEIVEDLAFTIKLVKEGHPPLLISDQLVTSQLATNNDASTHQRARWERGSLSMMRQHSLPLLKSAITNRKLSHIAMALDIAIPPLVLMLAGLVGLLFILIVPALLGMSQAWFQVAGTLFLVLIGLFLTWLRYGRRILPLSSFAGMVGFLYQKLRIYGVEGKNSTKSWTRTDRD